jgi:protein phosphatase
VREDNQDSILLPETLPEQTRPIQPDKGLLYAIADGMGGYAHGGIASLMALEKLAQAVYQENGRSGAKALHRGIELANLSVYQTAQRLNAGRMGTTLTAARILGRRLHLGHVGDSRAYLVRDGRATCLTDDHTLVGDMVRMRIISPDKVRAHAQRSILTRAVGLALFLQADIDEIELCPGDRLVLCCDGVWSMVQDEEFAALARQARSAAELSQHLVDLALERGTDDNVSAVSMLVHALPEAHNGHNGHNGHSKWSLQGLLSATRILGRKNKLEKGDEDTEKMDYCERSAPAIIHFFGYTPPSPG